MDWPLYVQDMRTYRTERGLTQLELDDLVGVTTGYTAKLEIRTKRPTISMLEFYAEALDCDVRLIPRESEDNMDGKKPRSKNYSKSKGTRIENEIVSKLQEKDIPAERVIMSGALGHLRDDLKHDIRVGPFSGEVKARSDGKGFIQLENWMGDADLLFLRRDRSQPMVCMNWDTFLKVMAQFKEEKPQDEG